MFELSTIKKGKKPFKMHPFQIPTVPSSAVMRRWESAEAAESSVASVMVNCCQLFMLVLCAPLTVSSEGF